MKRQLSFVLLASLLLTACASIFPAPTPTPTLTPTITPTPTVTPTPTPPELPAIFQTSVLNSLSIPRTYVQDTCQYLRQKWDPNNSAPGTVVMPIMFHSFTNGEPPANEPFYMSEFNFYTLIQALHDNGFQAITMSQLEAFLYNNAKIPPRSVLLIIDDRHFLPYFDTYWRPFWATYGWPIVNSFIGLDDGFIGLWQDMANLASEGFVDIQAHGANFHNSPIDPSWSDDQILSELNDSMTFITQHFGKAPIAYIWPGGGFTPRSAELAQQAGYKMAFTINPRGPLMFNWIPLADEQDPNSPYVLIPEGSVNNPLMVLPRYWNIDAIYRMPEAIQISQEAATYAEQNKATELEYYDIVCAPTLGSMPIAEPSATPKPSDTPAATPSDTPSTTP